MSHKRKRIDIIPIYPVKKFKTDDIEQNIPLPKDIMVKISSYLIMPWLNCSVNGKKAYTKWARTIRTLRLINLYWSKCVTKLIKNDNRYLHPLLLSGRHINLKLFSGITHIDASIMEMSVISVSDIRDDDTEWQWTLNRIFNHSLQVDLNANSLSLTLDKFCYLSCKNNNLLNVGLLRKWGNIKIFLEQLTSINNYETFYNHFSLGYCKNLTKLNIDSCNTSVTKQLKYLTKLKQLKFVCGLSSNAAITDNVMLSLTNLTNLNIYEFAMKITDNSLKQLTNLKKLKIGGMSEGVSKNSISKLTNLTYLNIKHMCFMKDEYQLDTESMFSLKSLKILKIHDRHQKALTNEYIDSLKQAGVEVSIYCGYDDKNMKVYVKQMFG